MSDNPKQEANAADDQGANYAKLLLQPIALGPLALALGLLAGHCSAPVPRVASADHEHPIVVQVVGTDTPEPAVVREDTPATDLQCFTLMRSQSPQRVSQAYHHYRGADAATRQEEPPRPPSLPAELEWSPAWVESAEKRDGMWLESDASLKRRQEASDKAWRECRDRVSIEPAPKIIDTAVNKYGFKRANLPLRHVWPDDCDIGGEGVSVGGYRYEFASIYECKTQFERWESYGEIWVDWKDEP